MPEEEEERAQNEENEKKNEESDTKESMEVDEHERKKNEDEQVMNKEKEEGKQGKTLTKKEEEEEKEKKNGNEAEKQEKTDSFKESEKKKNDGTWGLDSEGEGVRQVVLFERQPEEVGMSEFLGLQRGFSGVVKNRWEDFHVHEIDLQGRVVRLTSTDLPAEDCKEKVSRSWLLSDTILRAQTILMFFFVVASLS